jgi:hypothetical protein
MVASYSSASPSSWRPMARTLGALFAGSAVTLSATVVHGGSLLLARDKAGSIAESSASPTVAEPQQLPPTSSTASLSGPGQAAPWTPGATPQWGSSLRDLPVRRAPVQEAPRQSVPVATASVATASAGPAGSGTSAADPTAPRHDAEDASTGNAGFGGAAPQAADPQQGGSFNGLLSSVFHVTKGLPH